MGVMRTHPWWDRREVVKACARREAAVRDLRRWYVERGVIQPEGVMEEQEKDEPDRCLICGNVLDDDGVCPACGAEHVA